MHRALFVLLAIAATGSLVASGRAGAASGAAVVTSPSPTAHVSVSPTATPAYYPGAASLSGRVIGLSPGLVVDSAGHATEVDLQSVVDVWKETSVPASALEVGDDVFVNGTDGSPFVARYIYANIGRIDSVIRAIDQTGMLVDVQLRAGSVSKRIDFSAFIEYGAPAANLRVTRAELVVGRTIGAVVYCPRVGPLRATRIWFW